MSIAAEVKSQPQTSPIFGALTLGKIAHLDPETIMTTPEVAQVLRVSTRTLESWRVRGVGPRWSRLARVVYRVGDVLAYTRNPRP